MASIVDMAVDNGEGVCPMAAERNVSTSFALERSAPAPASVGRSQFAVGSSACVWPPARRAFNAGVSAMLVSRMPSGPVMRAFTSAS